MLIMLDCTTGLHHGHEEILASSHWRISDQLSIFIGRESLDMIGQRAKLTYPLYT